MAQVVPYITVFTLFDIFPICFARLLTPVQNIGYLVFIVNIAVSPFVETNYFGTVRQSTATYAVYRPRVGNIASTVVRLELDGIRMKWQKDIRLPLYCSRSRRVEHIEDSGIGKVSFACCCKASV